MNGPLILSMSFALAVAPHAGGDDGVVGSPASDVYGAPFNLLGAQGLSGWSVSGDADFSVEAGLLTAQGRGGGSGRLTSDAVYGDFSLEFEVQLAVGAASVTVRSAAHDSALATGHQMPLDHGAPHVACGLYSVHREKWMSAPTEWTVQGGAFDHTAWNKIRIECVGPSVRTWINGVPAATELDADVLAGRIAFEVDGDGLARFRGMRLSWLGESWWQPIFDGASTFGWHEIGGADWAVEDGVLVGRQEKDDPAHGHLVTDRAYEDFTVRVEYRAVRGNSGLYFRIIETGKGPGVQGFQAEIDASKDAGGLYETGGRGWVVQPSPEDVASWFRPGEWNTMIVTARGSHLAVD
ncbi:MAG: DUF1080 domain-containing protein, partial [Planctomycetota bacterium]|nr:DUF1080 domain-containing protein [Planctomycetota bacterium]